MAPAWRLLRAARARLHAAHGLQRSVCDAAHAHAAPRAAGLQTAPPRSPPCDPAPHSNQPALYEAFGLTVVEAMTCGWACGLRGGLGLGRASGRASGPDCGRWGGAGQGRAGWGGVGRMRGHLAAGSPQIAPVQLVGGSHGTVGVIP